MTANDLLAELRCRGVELRAEGARLRFRPADAVPSELLANLRQYRTELLAVLSADADKTQLALQQRGLCQQQPQAETYADREIRRFLEVCKPWPDGRGWYDPGACWLWGVREYFEYLKKPVPAKPQSSTIGGLDPDRPGALDILTREQLDQYQKARSAFSGDDPVAAHAHAWRVTLSGQLVSDSRYRPFDNTKNVSDN